MSNQSFSKIHPLGLSTPITKVDHMSDRPYENRNLSVSKGHLNQSGVANFPGLPESSVFGEFKQCVMGYWMGYKVIGL